MKKIIFAILCFLPLWTSAQVVIGVPNNTDPGASATSNNANYTIGSDQPKDSTFQLVTCAGVDDPRTTDKKEVECDYNQAIATFSRIISFVLYLLIPIVLGMILWIGWTYLTANGDSGKLAHAKDMIKPLLLGIFFIFAAYLIVYKLILGNLLADKVGDINKTDIINTGGSQ